MFINLTLAALALFLLYRVFGPKPFRITSGEAHRMVDEGALLLDVRSPQEFEQGHLEGATLIPLHELKERAKELHNGQKVVVYCRSGNRSHRAAKILNDQEFDVSDLGPMGAW